MKKLVLLSFVMLVFVFISCSVTDKLLPSYNCTDELDVANRTFNNYKYKATSLTSLVSNSGVLNAADPALGQNMSTVAGWVADLPRLDKVHKDATRYLVSSNDNFLRAVGEKETLDKIEKEIRDLGKNASEDEKQAKYLSVLNDPNLKQKLADAAKKTDKISEDKKQYLDKAYIHMTYGLTFDAVTVGISSMVVTEGESQISNLRSSLSNAVELSQKSSCIKKSVDRAVDVSSSAKDQVGPAINIFNAIVKIYQSSGYKLPAVAAADGKPITSDLP